MARQPEPAQHRVGRAGRASSSDGHPRRHVEPDDLPKGDQRQRRLRRAVPLAAGARRSVEEAYWELVIDDIINALECCGPSSTSADGGDGFVSIEVSPRHRPRHRCHRSPMRGTCTSASPAQPVGQDPGHRRGRARDPPDDRRGPQHQHHADLQPRALRRGHRGVPRRASRSSPRGGGDLRSCTASPRSSSAASTPKSTAASTRSARPRRSGCAGKAAVAQAKLAYQIFRDRFSGERWDALAAKGAQRAAAAVGVDVHQEPGLPRPALRRHADRPRHGQHAARRDRSRRSSITASSHRTIDDGVEEAAAILEALERLGIDLDDVGADARGRRRRRRSSSPTTSCCSR